MSWVFLLGLEDHGSIPVHFRARQVLRTYAISNKPRTTCTASSLIPSSHSFSLKKERTTGIFDPSDEPGLAACPLQHVAAMPAASRRLIMSRMAQSARLMCGKLAASADHKISCSISQNLRRPTRSIAVSPGISTLFKRFPCAHKEGRRHSPWRTHQEKKGSTCPRVPTVLGGPRASDACR